MTSRFAALGLAVCGLVSLSGANGASAADQQTLTISVYGISQEGFKKDLYTPFEAICGCKLVVDAGNSAERLARLEARKDDPVVDVAALADFSALEAAHKGLIEPVDTSKLANLGKLYEFARDPLGGHLAVGYTFYATSIVYRSDKLKIDSWADLLAPTLRDRLALPNITTTQGPLTLFMLDRALGGQSPDFATAIDKVAEAKHDIVTFYERSAQLNQLLQQGDVWASVTGRFGWGSIHKLSVPIAWAEPKEGQTGGMNVLTVVKGSKNRELALKFIDFWLSDAVQMALAMDGFDSPANAGVKVPPEIAENLTYGADTVKHLHLMDPADVLANRDAWLAAWNAKVAN